MTINIVVREDVSIEVRAELVKLGQTLTQMRDEIMATLQELKDAVAANTSVGQSVVTLIDGLVAKIQEQMNAAGTLAELQAGLQSVVDEVNADTTLLAAKVQENTVASAEPAPVPAEEEAPVPPSE